MRHIWHQASNQRLQMHPTTRKDTWQQIQWTFDQSIRCEIKSTAAPAYMAQVQSSTIGHTPKQLNSRVHTRRPSVLPPKAVASKGWRPRYMCRPLRIHRHEPGQPATTICRLLQVLTCMIERARGGEPKADQCPASKERRSVGMSVWPLLHKGTGSLRAMTTCLHRDVPWEKELVARGTGNPPRAASCSVGTCVVAIMEQKQTTRRPTLFELIL
ncbi:hypothetical protein J3F84DRAFT_380538, partial [Trichoderma pleuroticola]